MGSQRLVSSARRRITSGFMCALEPAEARCYRVRDGAVYWVGPRAEALSVLRVLVDDRAKCADNVLALCINGVEPTARKRADVVLGTRGLDMATTPRIKVTVTAHQGAVYGHALGDWLGCMLVRRWDRQTRETRPPVAMRGPAADGGAWYYGNRWWSDVAMDVLHLTDANGAVGAYTFETGWHRLHPRRSAACGS